MDADGAIDGESETMDGAADAPGEADEPGDALTCPTAGEGVGDGPGWEAGPPARTSAPVTPSSATTTMPSKSATRFQSCSVTATSEAPPA